MKVFGTRTPMTFIHRKKIFPSNSLLLISQTDYNELPNSFRRAEFAHEPVLSMDGFSKSGLENGGYIQQNQFAVFYRIHA